MQGTAAQQQANRPGRSAKRVAHQKEGILVKAPHHEGGLSRAGSLWQQGFLLSRAAKLCQVLQARLQSLQC